MKRNLKVEVNRGDIYGDLTVIEEVEPEYTNRGKIKRMVSVRCKCGNVCVKRLTYLRFGDTTTCGKCDTMSVRDISGVVVNRLTVLDEKVRIDGEVHWKCQCSCGNSIFVQHGRLVGKKITNCGKCGTKNGAVYVGDKYVSSSGDSVTVVDVSGGINKIMVVFDNDIESYITTSHNALKRGMFSNPRKSLVAGVGQYGVGKYVAKIDGKHTWEYSKWNSMLKRCYVRNSINIAYDGVTVSEEWHDYQNFADWVTQQVGYGVDGFCLDKDLLLKGNTQYSKDACVLIPTEINAFIRRSSMNGLPLGVDLHHKASGETLYRAQSSDGGNVIHLGLYKTVEEAFYKYKQHKEQRAKILADMWKDHVDPKVYDALMNYTVDIDD